jgi:hypothetical protein
MNDTPGIDARKDTFDRAFQKHRESLGKHALMPLHRNYFEAGFEAGEAYHQELSGNVSREEEKPTPGLKTLPPATVDELIHEAIGIGKTIASINTAIEEWSIEWSNKHPTTRRHARFDEPIFCELAHERDLLRERLADINIEIQLVNEREASWEVKS